MELTPFLDSSVAIMFCQKKTADYPALAQGYGGQAADATNRK